MAKKVRQLSYNDAYKKIKPYIDLKIDLRKKLNRAQKWQISYYFNKLNSYRAIDKHGELKDVRLFRPKNAKKLAELKKRYGIKNKRIKVVPIPSKTIGNAKERILKSGEIVFTTKHTKKILISFDNSELENILEETYMDLEAGEEPDTDLIEMFCRAKLKKYLKLKENEYYSIKIGSFDKGMYLDIGALAQGILGNLQSKIKNYDWVKKNIDGFYVNKFLNQRQPTANEKGKIHGKRKKKNSRRRLRD